MATISTLIQEAPERGAARLLLGAAWHLIGWVDALGMTPRFDLGRGIVDEDMAVEHLTALKPVQQVSGSWERDHIRLHLSPLAPDSAEHLSYTIARQNGGLAGMARTIEGAPELPEDKLVVVMGDRVLEVTRNAWMAFGRLYDDAELHLNAAGDSPRADFALSLGLPEAVLDGASAVIQLGKQIDDDSVFLTITGEDLDQSAG